MGPLLEAYEMTEESSRDDVYEVNPERTPAWFLRELEAAGIPRRFRAEDLTGPQAECLAFLDTMLNLVSQGRVEPMICPDGQVRYKAVLPRGGETKP